MQTINISYKDVSGADTVTPLFETGSVCTIGHFDGMHRGHQHVIEEMVKTAREALTPLTSIAITFDRHPRTLFDPTFKAQMLSTVDERRHLLSLTDVDACTVLQFDRDMAGMTAREFMEKILVNKLGAKILLLGYDNHFGKKNPEEGFDDYVRYGNELGLKVIRCDAVSAFGSRNISSTLVREMLTDGYVAEGAEYLGHPYSIEGTVVSGFHEGRKLGFPTANLDVASDKLIPERGVYAVKVRVEGSMLDLHGMMNIGCRPTYGNNKLTLETNIFRFKEDIYGKRMRVAFIKRLRREKFFPSVEELRNQLILDRINADEALTDEFFSPLIK